VSKAFFGQFDRISSDILKFRLAADKKLQKMFYID
jgi:hypothetical protein